MSFPIIGRFLSVMSRQAVSSLAQGSGSPFQGIRSSNTSRTPQTIYAANLENAYSKTPSDQKQNIQYMRQHLIDYSSHIKKS